MSDEFVRISIQGFRGSKYESEVYELTKDIRPINIKKIKRTVNQMCSEAIDKDAEEIIIYLDQMKDLKPR